MRTRTPRLLICVICFLAARLLFVAPHPPVRRSGKWRCLETLIGRVGPHIDSPTHVALSAFSVEKALSYEAMETPPDDMEGLDDLREIVAAHKDDPTWHQVDDDRVKRIFVASKMDVKVAYDRLKSLVKWQSEMFPIDPELIKPEVETGKLILQGQDKLGHPVLYTICRRHDRFKRDVRGCMSNVVFNVEEAISSMPPGIGKLLLVFDARSLGLRQADLTILREAINLLQRLYPVRAYKLYCVGLPSIVNYLWAFAKKFLDPLSASKVVFLKNMDELTEFVASEEMPDEIRSQVGHSK